MRDFFFPNLIGKLRLLCFLIPPPRAHGCCLLSLQKTSKFKALRRLLLLVWTEIKLLALRVNGRSQFSVLFLRTKVRLNNIERFLVDFHILVRLQKFNLVQSFK